MDEQPPEGVESRRSRLRRWVYRGSIALILAGCTTQLTVRDRYPFPVTLFYYGLPRPILMGLALLIAAIATKWRFRAIGLILAAVLGAAVWQRDFERHPDSRHSDSGQTVGFWNVGRDLTEDVAFVDRLLETTPDLMGFVETGDLSADWLKKWRLRHLDYSLVKMPNDCLFAVRGAVREQGEIFLAKGSFASWVDAEIQGVVVRAVVVDIAANVWLSRKEALLNLAAAVNSWGDRPVIVMGDFNTPDESVWFNPLRQEFREVFRTAGSGYVPTWPWPCPVLKLDQIWINRRIQLFHAWESSNWHSDHRMVWAQVNWSEPVE